MAKRTDNVTRIETWNVEKHKTANGGRGIQGSHAQVTKVATRNSLGQFHGATNFRGTVLG